MTHMIDYIFDPQLDDAHFYDVALCGEDVGPCEGTYNVALAMYPAYLRRLRQREASG